MSLGNHTPRVMDLAAIRLGEVEEVEKGLFRHRDSLTARLARFFAAKPEPTPQPIQAAPAKPRRLRKPAGES